MLRRSCRTCAALQHGGLGNPQPFAHSAISGASGAALRTDSVAKGGFQPDRTEDGAWDPSHPNDFYFVTANDLRPVATFDPARFSGATPITLDEESSGIIEAESLFGPGSFVFDAQVHTSTGLSNPTRDAERGQYMLMTVDFSKVFVGPSPIIPEVPSILLLPVLD
jgi:hypothetical protein